MTTALTQSFFKQEYLFSLSQLLNNFSKKNYVDRHFEQHFDEIISFD